MTCLWLTQDGRMGVGEVPQRTPLVEVLNLDYDGKAHPEVQPPSAPGNPEPPETLGSDS